KVFTVSWLRFIPIATIATSQPESGSAWVHPFSISAELTAPLIRSIHNGFFVSTFCQQKVLYRPKSVVRSKSVLTSAANEEVAKDRQRTSRIRTDTGFFDLVSLFLIFMIVSF